MAIKSDFSRTKIIGTIGPACEDPMVLQQMMEAGLNVARVNCSHGEPAELMRLINYINETSSRLDCPLPILADLSGPKIRLGVLPNDIPVKKGDKVILCSNPDNKDPGKFTAGYPGLADDISVGHKILIDDGLIQLQVSKVNAPDIECEVMNDGILKSRKGINLPGVPISLSALTEKDRRDVAFLAKAEIDYIALSFVRRGEDIRELRALLKEQGCNLPIIAKVEKPEAVDDLESIIEEADIIMVARGDLGVEIPTEDVPIVQKKIIAMCNSENKPVITATQMLDSMITNPRPTRAEASDVANAVFDGTDAVMLSGETSVGQYPVEVVRTMKKIVKTAEQNMTEERLVTMRRREKLKTHEALICHAACMMAEQSDARFMVAITQSGRTARLLSQYRSSVPILAFTQNEKTIRYLSIVWGVKAERIMHVTDTDSTLKEALHLAKERGFVEAGDTVIYATGIPLLESKTTNMIKIEKIE
ncbi:MULTISPECIES: pyruvate kinase [unclassified Oceanispirochaeta]|uniref:pyruvate kinase n=1 Tax=unclassified Oceanispirochaeta TaxID=2635722 RepID=UPI000E099482|nr:MULTISPECIES: pyruvate kinase [unclassified Oceanispirochaeta]MBF9018391.1 pyruvate kinase [Oceanispirochaeta sp. M2]NPD75195.1 pyruvate kinase [Oceanispirochaeta sp. M1]RDG28945.1 pyruvate kinase [Oceanispirochaeta sp. M1]